MGAKDSLSEKSRAEFYRCARNFIFGKINARKNKLPQGYLDVLTIADAVEDEGVEEGFKVFEKVATTNKITSYEASVLKEMVREELIDRGMVI